MRCENCGSPKIYTDAIVALKEALSEWRERARAAYVRLAGENPWADK